MRTSEEFVRHFFIEPFDFSCWFTDQYLYIFCRNVNFIFFWEIVANFFKIWDRFVVLIVHPRNPLCPFCISYFSRTFWADKTWRTEEFFADSVTSKQVSKVFFFLFLSSVITLGIFHFWIIFPVLLQRFFLFVNFFYSSVLASHCVDEPRQTFTIGFSADGWFFLFYVFLNISENFLAYLSTHFWFLFRYRLKLPFSVKSIVEFFILHH